MKGSKYQYQIITVLNPKTEEKEKILDSALSLIEKSGAVVVNKDHMGLKDLAYEIEDLNKGDFWVFDVESEKAIKLEEFNLFLNRESNIIRYLILKK